jgi:hypothetical protein
VSRDRMIFIQSAAAREGEHPSMWLRDAADQPPLRPVPQPPSRDSIAKVGWDRVGHA